MEKRIVIASILSIVLIVAWWGYFMPKMQPSKPVNSAVKKALPIKTVKIPKANNQTGSANSAAAKAAGKSKGTIAISRSVNLAKNIFYKGKYFYASFDIPSGSIIGLKLLKYSYNEKNLENKVNFANTQKKIQVVNFIPNKTYSSLKLLKISKKAGQVKFTYMADNKIIFTKSYEFLNGKYILKNNISVKNLTGKPILFKGHYVFSSGLKPALKNLNYINLAPIVYLNKNSISPNITGTIKYKGGISFAGFNSKYFLFSFLNPGNNIIVKKTGDTVKFIIPEKTLIAPGKTAQIHLSIYGGPKKLSLLDQTGHNLNSTLSYGFFGFFSILLLHILEFFYGFVHNYGLAIVLLVVAIRILFYPLTYTGFKSMKQMQKLTPKINELREKYKDNKAELNKKIMELYKESRVNPFGGCLPMILQIPVFYGLYMTLLTSIQLRNAPFIFWINNLAMQDPYYILPVLMGLSMLISQKMNSVIGDPTQAKIMLILPIVFTFIFIHYPAGLLLYWTVNNLLTIVQQYTINRKFA